MGQRIGFREPVSCAIIRENSLVPVGVNNPRDIITGIILVLHVVPATVSLDPDHPSAGVIGVRRALCDCIDKLADYRPEVWYVIRKRHMGGGRIRRSRS